MAANSSPIYRSVEKSGNPSPIRTSAALLFRNAMQGRKSKDATPFALCLGQDVRATIRVRSLLSWSQLG